MEANGNDKKLDTNQVPTSGIEDFPSGTKDNQKPSGVGTKEAGETPPPAAKPEPKPEPSMQPAPSKDPRVQANLAADSKKPDTKDSAAGSDQGMGSIRSNTTSNREAEMGNDQRSGLKLGQQQTASNVNMSRSAGENERSDEKLTDAGRQAQANASREKATRDERSDEKLTDAGRKQQEISRGATAQRNDDADSKKIGAQDVGMAKPQSNRQAEMGNDSRSKPPSAVDKSIASDNPGTPAPPVRSAPKPAPQGQGPAKPAPQAAKPGAAPEAKPEGGNWFTRTFGAKPNGPAPVAGTGSGDQSPIDALRQYNDAKSKGAFDQKPAAPAPAPAARPQAQAPRPQAQAPRPQQSQGQGAANRGPADQGDRVAAAAAEMKKKQAVSGNINNNVA
jgi:hypothetical protein